MQLLREGRSFSGHERNCAFINIHGGRFANASAITGLDFDDDGRAVAVTDWDHDGDLDIWLGNRTGPRLRLMRNQTIVGKVPKDAHFIAFRLQGTASNRDAIGARIMLTTRPANSQDTGQSGDSGISQSVQTIYAGDAYLSQSSKWVHFGLGRDTVIDQVTVRWPNGNREEFSVAKLTADKRYRLIEGTGVANLLAVPRQSLALQPAEQHRLKPSSISRTILSNRFPMPILRYTDFNGSVQKSIGTGGQPLLVNLWASWCPNCVEELNALNEHAVRLQQRGLEILALSLDGLGRAQRSEPADAQQLLERLQFSFPAGVATRELVEKLEFTEGIVLNRQPALALPSSFLLDADGALAAIYHGPVDVERLLHDVEQLDGPLRDRRDLATPLAGRWSRAPRQLLLRAVARLFDERGYAEDYARYLALDAEVLNRRRAGLPNAQRQHLDAQYASANFELGLTLASSGDVADAMEYFQRAVEVQPEHVEAHINLGALLARGSQLEEAISHLRQAVRLDPDSSEARINLATALSSQNLFTEAIEHYRHILSLPSSSAQVHGRLGRALLEIGNVPEAVEHLEHALRLNANHRAVRITLAWLRATSPDASIRNGEQAVALATPLTTANAGTDPLALDVLAASYAEQGDFVLAQQAAERAIEASRQSSALRARMIARLKGYELGKPHRDPDGKYP